MFRALVSTLSLSSALGDAQLRHSRNISMSSTNNPSFLLHFPFIDTAMSNTSMQTQEKSIHISSVYKESQTLDRQFSFLEVYRDRYTFHTSQTFTHLTKMFFNAVKFCLFLTWTLVRGDTVRNIDMDLQQDRDSLRLEFTAVERTFRLELTKVEYDGSLSSEEEIYANDQTSLLLKHGEFLSLEGILENDFIIRPTGDNLSHTVTEIKDSNLANDYEVPENTVPSPSLLEIVKLTRSKRSIPSIVQPEILIVVDKSLYHQLGSDDSAVNNYVRNFWNAVNLRFRLISSPRVELNIAGIIISKSSAQTPYLRDSKVSGNMFEARKALDLMGKHFYKSDSSLPIFDMAVTMTSLDMCRYKTGGRGGCNKNTVGYAYVGGACVVNKALRKVNSVAIVEDSGGYSGVIVAAHEVAHLLGAVHDGDGAAVNVGGPGARQCSWGAGHIMSDARRTERGLAWSDCTKAQLSHFLSSSTAQCLTNRPHARQPELSLRGDHQPSLDEQCQADQGSNACFQDSRVCAQLFCHNTVTGTCVSYRPALEGSHCGHGKVCYDGVCQEKRKTTSVRIKQPATFVKLQKVKQPVKFLKIKLNKKKHTKTNKVKTISAKCHDNQKINVRGVNSCHDLLQSFSFAYCGNKYIQTICCASHALFCN